MTEENIIRLDDYREPLSEPEYAQVGEYGPIFELRPPNTVQSLKERARGRPFLCHLRHRWHIVGEVKVPEDSSDTVALFNAALHAGKALYQCRRCGGVRYRVFL